MPTPETEHDAHIVVPENEFTGSSSPDGRFVTFSTARGRREKVRPIDDSDLAVYTLMPLIAASSAFVLGVGSDNLQNALMFMGGILCVGLCVTFVKRNATYLPWPWCEVLVVCAVGYLGYRLTGDAGYRALGIDLVPAVLILVGVLVRYAFYYRESAVWEPFVTTVALSVSLGSAIWMGPEQPTIALVAFLGAFFISMVALLSLVFSYFSYEHALGRLRD